MADKKVTQLAEVTQVSSDDLLLVVNDPSGNPSSNKVTASNLVGNVRFDSKFYKTTTLQGNTVINGSTLTINANTTFKNGRDYALEIDNKYDIANADALFATVSQLIEKTSQDDVVNLMESNTTIDYSANSVTVLQNKGLIVKAGGIASNVVPATSNATNEGYESGTIWYSNNHLYIAVDADTIKRVALSTF